MKLQMLLAMTHYGYDEGADAWHRMTKLFPELSDQLAQAFEALNAADALVSALKRPEELTRERELELIAAYEKVRNK